jgi:hypothetical protein
MRRASPEFSDTIFKRQYVHKNPFRASALDDERKKQDHIGMWKKCFLVQPVDLQ